MARILCFGSRSFNERNAVHEFLSRAADSPFWDKTIRVVPGAAKGADLLAASVAVELGMQVEAHPADWAAHGNAAGPIRNSKMLASGVDFAIGFFDGATPGSMDMLKKLIAAGVDVRVVTTRKR